MYTIAATAFAVLYLLHTYCKGLNNFCTSKKTLHSKTVVITGGTSGLGLQAAIDFARRGAKVIIACPFEDEGANGRDEVISRTGNEKIVFKLLDLSSLQSVRGFANYVLTTESRLDVLVNNAGVVEWGDVETADGMNYIMQVNYYGHYLLTLLLLPLLKNTGTAAEKSRIVLLSSGMHRLAMRDVTKYNRTGYYRFHMFIYNNSKQCLVMFARELTEKLRDANVVVYCVNPGIVGTRIYGRVNAAFGVIAIFFINIFFKNPREGVQTTLHVALDDAASNVSGEYFVNCRISRASDLSYDEEKAQYVWKESMRLVGLSDEDMKRLLN